MTIEKRPPRAPMRFEITHHLPPGARLVLPAAAVKDLVRLFGEQALARVGMEVRRDRDA